MIFMEILQLDCYAVQELSPSRNPLHNCNLYYLTILDVFYSKLRL